MPSFLLKNFSIEDNSNVQNRKIKTTEIEKFKDLLVQGMHILSLRFVNQDADLLFNFSEQDNFFVQGDCLFYRDKEFEFCIAENYVQPATKFYFNELQRSLDHYYFKILSPILNESLGNSKEQEIPVDFNNLKWWISEPKLEKKWNTVLALITEAFPIIKNKEDIFRVMTLGAYGIPISDSLRVANGSPFRTSPNSPGEIDTDRFFPLYIPER